MAATSLVPLLGANLLGCSDSSDSRSSAGPATTSGQFLHGIASGDPLSDRVILWTRITPDEEGVAGLAWEVASDAQFTDVVASGSGTTDASVDYTAKVDVTDLEPGAHYYYRFTSGDNVSAVGSTRTLPVGQVAAASFAVVSCSNYPAGFFHVYREVANQELDAVLHLGDYIYEYAADGYASERAEEFGRVSDPETEIVSLSDYRRRYAQYRTDNDLQAAHAAHPFIVVWDDHEITNHESANNPWTEGAQNHQPETEGSFEDRKAAAVQAWYEWLPVRPPSAQQDIIYRHFNYGDLLDLFMLDTRLIGRDEQNTYTDFVNG
ncbi:MAG: alkaline phosphatase D family protein, partial [Halioglobus sp.]